MNSSPDDRKKVKPANWYQNVNCAIEGILWAVKTQTHMRFHMLAALVVLLIAAILKVSALEFVLLTLAITFVLVAEMFNTAIEVVVDMISPEYHPLARTIKDVAAGAVLIASIGAVLLGYLILSGHLFPPLEEKLRLLQPPVGEIAVLSILVTTILVVLVKSLTGRGSPLHGGMPSGHSAIAFSVAVSLALSGIGPVYILLAFFLAGMVSHSRLLMGIHSLVEVLLGALMGIVVAFAIYFLFG